MKRNLYLLISWPILIAAGWVATKLSEKYGNSLDDLQYEFDFE